MANSESEGEAAVRARRARTEQAEELAGIATVFRRAADLGPQMLALQQALLDGIALSQRREAERLAKRKEDDSRVADTQARAERAAALATAAASAGTAASRVIEVLRRDGLFQGYVAQADGAPAAGFTVQVRGAAGDRESAPLTAKTADDGYFRIERATPKGAARQRKGVQEIVDRLSTVGAATSPSTGGSTGASAAAPSGSPGQSAAAAQVEVLDTTGRVIFRDPLPPTFSDEASVFRYYVIPKTTPAAKEKK
jgi:hypothetical protein